jgi:hypothetical protein
MNFTQAKTPMKIDSSNYLGIKHDNYLADIYTMALANPTKFNFLRAKVSEYLKTSMTENLFKLIFNLMLDGTDLTGNISIINDGTRPLQPQVPEDDVHSFALSATKTLAGICDELLAKLLPKPMTEVMTAQFTKDGLAGTPQA